MEELIPAQAASRYRKAVDGYKSRLKDNPNLKLREYSKEIHTNYRGVIDWMRRNGIRTLDLKREASGETVCGMTNTGSGDAFIQFVPSNRLGRDLNDIYERGVERLGLICADGLKGLEDVIAEVFPKTPLQRCTTHLKRNIISDVRIGDKREVAKDLKQVFQLEYK